jgi:GNAT superfamily N-acetyltransferase
MNTEISRLRAQDIPMVVSLAKPIWQEHYSPIIGQQQVNYMLEKFQSHAAIQSQLDQGYQYFQVGQPPHLLGYFSIQFRENASLFISKFYLSKQARGKGIGKQMLHFIEQLAATNQCETIDLTVNKYNPAYQVYLKLGFTNQGSAEFDIGNGYIMDDYQMCKPVAD